MQRGNLTILQGRGHATIDVAGAHASTLDGGERDRLRPPDRRRRRDAQLLRPRRLGSARAGPEDAGRRVRHPRPRHRRLRAAPSARPTPAERDAWLTFVVIGGGPTGVEMAGTMSEIAQHTLRREFRRIDPTRRRVVLLEGCDRDPRRVRAEAVGSARASSSSGSASTCAPAAKVTGDRRRRRDLRDARRPTAARAAARRRAP